MGNQVRNGRNYKDNIIKLSLNSFSTNTAINNDNISAYNYKKLKNFKNIGFTEENYFSKILQSEQINTYNKKSVLNNININKDYLKNSRNAINSQKNKIIFLSSYSSKINKPNQNKKDILKNSPSPKLNTNNNNINNNNNNNKEGNANTNTKTIHTEIDKNNVDRHKIIHHNQSNNITHSNNLNKELLYDLLDKYIDKNGNNNNTNQKIKIDSKHYAENTNEKKSSINSSKFINFDIINENESIIDGIELTNHSIKNVESKINNYNCNNLNKDEFYEFEFEDYIKKLNLEEVNIDRELFERPLFYNRSKKISSKNKANANKLNNYSKTTNCDCDYLSKKINKNKCNISNYSNNIIKNSLRNSLKDNQGAKSNEKKILNKKNKYINESNKQNKNKNKINEKYNKIKDFSINSNTKSRRIFDFNKKKEKKGLSNSNSKLLISNNLYNITSNINKENVSFLNKNNSKKKENIHKDYFNFKKIIKKNFNNIHNFQITDFLLTSKQRFSKNKPQRNFQKSANISLKRIKSDTSSKIGSPDKGKKLYRQGRNGILCKYLKSNFNSANLSKVNNIYTTGNSFENNISSNNIIDEEINKKDYKIIRIFKNKNNNLGKNAFSNKNKDKKIINNDTKKITFNISNINNKNYNNPINKIKCKFINKRSVSSYNFFDIKDLKSNLIVKNNHYETNINNLVKSTNHCESIKKNKISSVFYKKASKDKFDKNLYSNKINKKSNLSNNKNTMNKGISNNKKQLINENKKYKNKKIIKISNYNHFLHKSYSKSNFLCKTNLIYSYKK